MDGMLCCYFVRSGVGDAHHVRGCTRVEDCSFIGVTMASCGWSRGRRLMLLCLIELLNYIFNVVVLSYFLFFFGRIARHVATHGVGTGC